VCLIGLLAPHSTHLLHLLTPSAACRLHHKLCTHRHLLLLLHAGGFATWAKTPAVLRSTPTFKGVSKSISALARQPLRGVRTS